MIRDATEADLEAILALNLAFEHWLSPLDLPALRQLHGAAARHTVAVTEEGIGAFLLVLGPGADYQSPNYRWFSDRHDRFLYVDRIAVAGGTHGKGLGGALYRDLIDHAAKNGVPRIVCEYCLEPPNPGSAAFHQRLGFVEVARQELPGGKIVSMQERAVPAPDGA